MLKNYLTVAIRNLLRNKTYLIINLSGLVLGIVTFIFAVLWIQAETSYDKFHVNAENLYRVDYRLYEEGVLEQYSASGSPAIGKEMKNTLPEVVEYTRFHRIEGVLNYEDNSFKESNVIYAQSSFFNVFTPLKVIYKIGELLD